MSWLRVTLWRWEDASPTRAGPGTKVSLRFPLGNRLARTAAIASVAQRYRGGSLVVRGGGEMRGWPADQLFTGPPLGVLRRAEKRQ
jgi:hypothetical protein